MISIKEYKENIYKIKVSKKNYYVNFHVMAMNMREVTNIAQRIIKDFNKIDFMNKYDIKYFNNIENIFLIKVKKNKLFFNPTFKKFYNYITFLSYLPTYNDYFHDDYIHQVSISEAEINKDKYLSYDNF